MGFREYGYLTLTVEAAKLSVDFTAVGRYESRLAGNDQYRFADAQAAVRAAQKDQKPLCGD
jgi:hypothetical protein